MSILYICFFGSQIKNFDSFFINIHYFTLKIDRTTLKRDVFAIFVPITTIQVSGSPINKNLLFFYEKLILNPKLT